MHAWNAPILDRIQREGLPHALLIHGAQGVGKLALAERIAQLVLCEAPPAAKKPCGQCDGCRWFLGGNHPDFRRVEPEALMPVAEVEEGDEAPAPARRAKPSFDIKIDQVRELADFLHIGSHRGARRVALVHPAEAMNPSAANALLKGLEEPPPAAMFILVSHRPSRLLATVRSRCVSLPVPIPAREAALEWLRADGLKDPERWLAYAGGAPLRAIAFASQAETLDRLMRGVASGADILIDDRESLEALAEALQKMALDRAFTASGLAAKYRTGTAKPDPVQAKAWLDYARQMGQNRALARHPVNTRLFAAEMLATMPSDEKHQ
jgi:DNA polymerase III subunit delta'